MHFAQIFSYFQLLSARLNNTFSVAMESEDFHIIVFIYSMLLTKVILPEAFEF